MPNFGLLQFHITHQNNVQQKEMVQFGMQLQTALAILVFNLEESV